jgi:hypothetical protein
MPLASQNNTEPFVERRRQAMIDRAISLQKEHDEQRRYAENALNLWDTERLGDLVDLGEGLLVAEVIDRSRGTLWEPLVDGQRSKTHERYDSRWHAILAAIGQRFDAGDDADLYAARVLRVPESWNSRPI